MCTSACAPAEQHVSTAGYRFVLCLTLLRWHPKAKVIQKSMSCSICAPRCRSARCVLWYSSASMRLVSVRAIRPLVPKACLITGCCCRLLACTWRCAAAYPQVPLPWQSLASPSRSGMRCADLVLSRPVPGPSCFRDTWPHVCVCVRMRIHVCVWERESGRESGGERGRAWPQMRSDSLCAL